MFFDTKAVHAGITPDPATGSIVPPIYQTATYILEEVGKDKGFDYTRSSNPTRATLENSLAILEGGKYGISFSSGMASVDAILKLLSSGDHVVSSNDVYGGVFRLFNEVLSRYGLSFTFVNTSEPSAVEEAIRPNTKLIWLETPTNPLLQITDIDLISKIAKAHDILLGVDSTFATPYLLRPLEWEVDIVMHSTTKYLSGHNQIIGGILITNSEELNGKLKFLQKTIGAVSSPFDCWLTLLGLKTLSLRMARHSSNGLEVAQFLADHPKVERVIYPGLQSHPQHEIAKRQMKAFSGMISFDLKGGFDAGKTLMNSVQLCALAESLGAVESMITHPASMTHADVPEDIRVARGLTNGLVRISVGIEDVRDIMADLEQALDKV
ncbi:MAG: PLP-dependent transferase [SAR324 cluster bacterium]|nr:PLP-dependent transferase [SAR324 cluster bacterium]